MQSERTIEVPTWFLPSYYGDVRLEAEGETATVVYAQDLSPTEEVAMEVLRRRALKNTMLSKPWAVESDFRPIAEKSYRETEVRVRLLAPIAKVASVLSRAMKPGRQTVSVVKFAGGRMEEVRSAKTSSTAIVLVDKPGEKKKTSALAKTDKKVVEAAVTIAKPTIGCPSPDFGQREIRARRVLDVFLDDRQRADLRATGRFVCVGQDTGRRYLLSLRDGPEGLSRTGMRSVFDLDAPEPGLRSGPLCVHDWTVPSAEELLAIHLCLSLPGRERAVRSLPEVGR